MTVASPFYIIIIVAIISFSVFIFIRRMLYLKSSYYKETNTPFFKVILNKGMYGEYLCFKAFRRVRGYHKALANVYLPKEKNGETTEIDVILIHSSGISVIESKNYSGWIFGDEKSKMWTQTFKNGHKERFYNPIFQNKTHIRALLYALSEYKETPIYSIIAFSERCTLKKVKVESNNHYVIKRNQLPSLLRKLNKHSAVLTENDIDTIYHQLKMYTNVDQLVKEQHIAAIQKYKA